jgi:uncharacterized protein (TIGR00156 family)
MKYLVLILIFLLYTPEVEAQYTGPSAVDRQMSVSYVLDNARRLHLRDTHVQLRGFVAEHIREDYYWFEDATGRIRIELYSDVMPARRFDETTEVLLTGEVDFKLLTGAYIWVKQVQFAETTAEQPAS